MDRLEQRAELGDIKPRRPSTVDAKTAPGHLAAERQALQVEEAAGPFQIGQRGRVRVDQPLELAPRRDLELQRLEELRIMTLQDPKERRDVPRYVVDHLGRRCNSTAQEYSAHADERFGVSRVRDAFDAPADRLGKTLLAADIGRGGPNGANVTKSSLHFLDLNEIESLPGHRGRRRADVEGFGVGRASFARDPWKARWRAPAPATSATADQIVEKRRWTCPAFGAEMRPMKRIRSHIPDRRLPLATLDDVQAKRLAELIEDGGPQDLEEIADLLGQNAGGGEKAKR